MQKRFALLPFLSAIVLFCGCSSTELISESHEFNPAASISSPYISESYEANSETVDSLLFVTTEIPAEIETSEVPETAEPEEIFRETTALEDDVTVGTTPETGTSDFTDSVAEYETTTEAVSSPPETTAIPSGSIFAVINTSSGKYHLDPNCRAVSNMNPENKLERSFKSTDVMEAAGYTPCGLCSKNEVKKKTTETSAPPPSYTTAADVTISEVSQDVYDAVINTNSRKIHLSPDCRYVKTMKDSNRFDTMLSSDDVKAMLDDGYSLCKSCSD